MVTSVPLIAQVPIKAPTANRIKIEPGDRDDRLQQG